MLFSTSSRRFESVWTVDSWLSVSSRSVSTLSSIPAFLPSSWFSFCLTSFFRSLSIFICSFFAFSSTPKATNFFCKSTSWLFIDVTSSMCSSSWEFRAFSSSWTDFLFSVTFSKSLFRLFWSCKKPLSRKSWISSSKLKTSSFNWRYLVVLSAWIFKLS